MLLIILLLFIMFLIFYCYSHLIFNFKIIENMEDNLEGSSCKSDRGVYLALKNAAKISNINEQLKNLINLNEKFTEIESKVNKNHDGINNLTKQLSQYTST